MANGPSEAFTANTLQAAEQSVKQVQGAMESYFSWLQNSMSGLPWANKDLLDQWKGFIEQNVAVVQEYTHKLSQAQDLQDVIQIQTAFMQKQMTVFSEQARVMAETYTKALSGGMKMPFDNRS
jgi:hypothetical protein